ncbi:hypothetical protein BF49_0779 [Bradyrhizobium sp.]|nr:hypothetical protein BF49_0779 [Bradyrhizobium sp.]
MTCWPWIKAKLTRHLDDLCRLASLTSFRRKYVALLLLAVRIRDGRQFIGREEAK